MKTNLVCVECPMGCEIEAEVENGVCVSVKGNSCNRGRLYAENEVVCPKRVLTTTVRANDGRMIPVKTDAPVKKSEMLNVMKKINGVHPKTSVKIGDVLVKNISDDANLVVAG